MASSSMLGATDWQDRTEAENEDPGLEEHVRRFGNVSLADRAPDGPDHGSPSSFRLDERATPKSVTGSYRRQIEHESPNQTVGGAQIDIRHHDFDEPDQHEFYSELQSELHRQDSLRHPDSLLHHHQDSFHQPDSYLGPDHDTAGPLDRLDTQPDGRASRASRAGSTIRRDNSGLADRDGSVRHAPDGYRMGDNATMRQSQFRQTAERADAGVDHDENDGSVMSLPASLPLPRNSLSHVSGHTTRSAVDPLARVRVDKVRSLPSISRAPKRGLLPDRSTRFAEEATEINRPVDETDVSISRISGRAGVDGDDGDAGPEWPVNTSLIDRDMARLMDVETSVYRPDEWNRSRLGEDAEISRADTMATTGTGESGTIRSNAVGMSGRVSQAGSSQALTLKEQSTLVDRLTKDNFDLKLKIHFLDQALQRRSAEGVGELVQENVQLQTDLAAERKESLALRRRAREAERRARAAEEELRAERSRTADGLRAEVAGLREQAERAERAVHQLRGRDHNRDRDRPEWPSNDGRGVEEAMDMWKDLLAAETARREQADEDAARLRGELARLAERARLPGGAVEVESTSKLVHENAELRRDLGAQTSMLTSRNRERERLQAEIEELKLAARRGVASVAGDSIFDRSVSRAGRGAASVAGSALAEAEAERDELEQRLASARDEVAQLRLLNHDLERELNEHLDLLQRAEAERADAAADRTELVAGIAERDELVGRLQAELEETVSRLEAAQAEIGSLTDAVLALEDERAATRARLQSVAAELEAANGELEMVDKRARELGSKNERLEVQLESLANEVGFLREEQEADKLRIGSLDASSAAAAAEADATKAALSEKTAEAASIQAEAEAASQQRDDARAQCAAWQAAIGRLRAGLAAVVGADPDEQAEELVGRVAGLKTALAEHARQLRDKDELVERAGLDLQAAGSAAEREKRALQQARARADQLATQNTALSETIRAHEARLRKLDGAMKRDRDQMAVLDNQLAARQTSQTALLLNVWQRLSSLCGTDWAAKNVLIDGQAVPTVESIGRNLPAFGKKVLLAIKTIERMVKGFRERLTTIERDLWRDYRTLESAIDARAKTIDRLELRVNALMFTPKGSTSAGPGPGSSAGPVSSPGPGQTEAALRRENLLLHARLAELQQQAQQHNTNPARARLSAAGSSNTAGQSVSAGSSGSNSMLPSSSSPAGTGPSGPGLTSLGPSSSTSRRSRTNNPSYCATPVSFDPTATVPGHTSRPSIDYVSTNPPPLPALGLALGPSDHSRSESVEVGGNPSSFDSTGPHHHQQHMSGLGISSATSIGVSTNQHHSGGSATGSSSGLTPSSTIGSTTTQTQTQPISTSSTTPNSQPSSGSTSINQPQSGLAAAPTISSSTVSTVVGTGMVIPSTGPISQAELARAALCHEFLQQAKEERGLRAMERSNARRRLMEREK